MGSERDLRVISIVDMSIFRDDVGRKEVGVVKCSNGTRGECEDRKGYHPKFGPLCAKGIDGPRGRRFKHHLCGT